MGQKLLAGILITNKWEKKGETNVVDKCPGLYFERRKRGTVEERGGGDLGENGEQEIRAVSTTYPFMTAERTGYGAGAFRKVTLIA